MRRLVLLSVLFALGCATVPAPVPCVAPAPVAAEAPKPAEPAPAAAGPTANSKTVAIGMSLARAEQVVADFEHFEQAMAWEGPTEPLREPKSTNDLFEILKRDQIDLFGVGIEFAKTQHDEKSRALQAQIELAWGDAQSELADLFTNVASHQRKEIQRLKAQTAGGDRPASAEEKLAAMQKTVQTYSDVSEALYRLADEHIAAGQSLAHDIIAHDPEDYLGYRLAADYYRMRGDWTKFDEMIAKVASKNPESNGLLFERAMDAIDRSGDAGKGETLLKQALTKDPHFVRAQAALVLTAETLASRNAALDTLQQLNPHHQIVLWLGPQIKSSFLGEPKK